MQAFCDETFNQISSRKLSNFQNTLVEAKIGTP